MCDCRSDVLQDGVKGNLDARALRPQIIIGAQMVEMAGGARTRRTVSDTVAYAPIPVKVVLHRVTPQGMNFAGVFQAPAVFIVNGWAISYHEAPNGS